MQKRYVLFGVVLSIIMRDRNRSYNISDNSRVRCVCVACASHVQRISAAPGYGNGCGMGAEWVRERSSEYGTGADLEVGAELASGKGFGSFIRQMLV